jgi:predicted O-linked N-acetylglucosamine transferase (SPINDLY family)
MPDDFGCYDPPAEAPAVGALPALANGFVTFGCFNLPSKITTRILDVWARLLREVPRSRLLLKYKGLDEGGTGERFRQMFAERGVAADRIQLSGWSPYAEFLTYYHRIDVALDPFPYTGGLTTCEALWMGVPVLTCPGETFASRHGLSHLSNIGLTETVAHNLDEYVEIGARLAGDLPHLADLRSGLRERMTGSPLCDGKRFADNLLAVVRHVWKEWVKQSV